MNKIKFVRERWSDTIPVFDIVYWSGRVRTIYLWPELELPRSVINFVNQPGIEITPSIDSIWGAEKVYQLK